MADYKTDQDRFFDNLRDIEDFREATEKRRMEELKALIDKFTRLLWKAIQLYPDFKPEKTKEADARRQIIEFLKSERKIPPTYTYPEA
jgi:hypothetical protein